MSSQKCIKCGVIETHNPDGVCVMCGLDGDEDGKKTNGGERMAKFKGRYKKQCTIEGCDKQGWRDGMCYRHWNIEHPEAKNPGVTKKPVDKGEETTPGRLRRPTPSLKKAGSLKQGAKASPPAPASPADDVAALAAQVLSDRDRLYYEMIKLESTLITLSKYKGIPLPDLKLLDGELK